MITLKEAIQLQGEDIKGLRKDLISRIEQDGSQAYIEQFSDEPIHTMGEGIPIAIKNNINVKGWGIDCSSNILKGYTSPYSATVIEKLYANGLSPMGKTEYGRVCDGQLHRA